MRRQLSRLAELSREHPQGVLAACMIVALAAFAWSEIRMLAHGQPEWATYFDQGEYLQSARALAAGKLDAASHHYPIGYALLAAPFTWLFRSDPFVVVNVLCLAGSLWAFVRIGEALGIARAIAGVIFLATSVLTPSVLMHYVMPWTSTPTTFLILTALALGFLPPTALRAFLVGLLAGLILAFKPVDIVALAPLAIYYAFMCLRERSVGALTDWPHALRLLALGAAGFAAGVATAASMHWLIYGWQLSKYERNTANGPVFNFDSLPIKLYSLFVDPTVVYGHFLQPIGIFTRYPWVFAGMLGSILLALRDLRLAVLALGVAIYVCFYAAYFDMIPNGLWYYNNIHYFTWCFPVFGLFAYLLICRLWRHPSIADTFIAILASTLLIGWRPVLTPISGTVAFESATAARLTVTGDAVPFVADLDGRLIDAQQVYHSLPGVHWGDRDLLAWRDCRALPRLRGARVLFMRPGNGRTLTIAWPDLKIADVNIVRLYRLDWRFL